ncbi:hypothetical protein ES319_A02G082700v1 [Gossypium barbadense]|uniref:Uncharacterized protein n=3 Tax=Gossypium TaxID=3633 RepID=A0A5J5WPT9_GOSBA|nr:hypothetical protein ES319_A02G082700v1 [Gossypium barbadense]TYH27739.1 hypothetical protein ES288_A02G092000v1 [Gossypium darwinii]TYI39378.1 hypothetical protein ES332_A02G094000v1 [Gossypium tomentosum]
MLPKLQKCERESPSPSVLGPILDDGEIPDDRLAGLLRCQTRVEEVVGVWATVAEVCGGWSRVLGFFLLCFC